MYDLIIIGGGPAGTTAGIYALRKKLKTLILSKDLFGQVGTAGVIENWPGEKEIIGPDLISKFTNHLLSYGAEIKEEEVVSLGEGFSVKTNKGEFSSRAVIVVSGRKPRAIGVTGEEEFVGKGVFYCTTCDAPLFQDKKVVVAGGGNAGVESAIELSRYAKEVSLFEASSEVRADEFLQEKAKKQGVKIYAGREITEIRGDLFLKEVEYIEKEEKKIIEVDGLFVQIGSVPLSSFAKGFLELNSGGEIKIDPRSCQSSVEGVFAAGDVTDVKHKQIIIAAGEGAKAALNAYDYLRR